MLSLALIGFTELWVILAIIVSILVLVSVGIIVIVRLSPRGPRSDENRKAGETSEGSQDAPQEGE